MSILIIAEKPDAARRIAEALAEGKSLKSYTDKNKVTYYDFERNGKKHIVACAVGHLFNLAPVERGWKYPVFSYTWKPSYEVSKQSAFSKKYFDVVKKIVSKGHDFIIATDYDTEGELIGANILRFLANRNDAKRMKFSVDHDEDLLLVNDDKTHIVKIGDFVDKFINSSNTISKDDYEIVDVSHLNFKTFSFNPKTFETSFKKIKALIRHPITSPLLEITLESGKKIRVTEGHSLFVLKNGEIKTIPTTDLKVGDFVVSPLSIDEPENYTYELDLGKELRGRKWKLPKKIPITKELVRLIGYYLAEGSCGIRRISLDFGLHEKYLAEDACRCIKHVFGQEVSPKPKKGCLNVSFGGKAGVIFFDKILKAGRTSSTKKIPDFVFNISPELKREFVKGIFRGDGTATGYTISLITSSKTLASQLVYLLLQMKIFADFIEYTFKHKDPAGKIRREKIYRISISNKIEQEKLVPLFPEWEEKLKKYRETRRKKQEWTNIKEMHTGIPILESGLPEFSNRKSKVGRVALKKYLIKAKMPKEKIEFLNKLLNSNLAFLRVNKIKKVKPTSNYVYDISVEENENFTCGIGGIFAHNSTLTKDELIEAYEKVLPHIDFGQLEAGLTRHELDWLWGINTTRALTLALKSAAEKGFAILSSGRVQSPTLAILLDRELEIRKFKPKPFWELELHIKINGTEAVASYEKGRIWKKEEADKILQECKGKDAKVKDIKKKKYKQAPPIPFNTTDLQAEAYQQFKFSPQQTMNIAESLYQAGYISYPRSNSQKLPPSINYEKILKALASLPQYKKFAEELLKKEKLVPVEGKREDPAHPCFPVDASFSLNPHSYMSFKDLTKFVKSWEWNEKKGSYFGKLSKPIKVLAFDSKNNKIVTSFVSGCWKTPFNKTLIKITTKSGNSIELTGNHPIMTLDATKGICFKEARELRAGDILLSKVKEDPAKNEKVIITEKGFVVSIPSSLTFEEIREIKIGRKVDYVYDLEVEKYHTFFVNNFLVHNCVYATHEVPDLSKLTPQQRKIYDLIARRTLAAFGDEALRETNTVSLDVAGHTFLLVGKRTLEPGWTKIYEPYLKREEIVLPELQIGQIIKVIKLEELAKETQPPARYSQGSIIKEMEARNLGTRATRSEILQTLYERGYIAGKSIQVTKLGEAVVKALKEYCPKILSEELTRKFEEEMELVYQGKKKREEVVEEAKKTLKEILEEFKANEKKIGKKLLEALMTKREEERKLGNCPNCKTGELRILRSRLSGKFFVGCSNYPNCKTGYPLPAGASIQATGNICEKCGTPIIQVFRKGKRPFRMCLDPKCESKKDWNNKRNENKLK